MNASPLDTHGSRSGSNGRAHRDSAPRTATDGGNVTTAPGGRYGDGKSSPEAPPAGAAALVSAISDEQLLAAYREGDKGGFAALVSRYQRELYHFLVRFLGNRAAAEDVFQETFLQVHQSAEAFDLQRRFKPWLFTIAANKARDLIRSQARRPTNPLQASISGSDEEGGEFIDLMQAGGELPDEPMARQEMQHKVQQVVATMPDHLREILVLSYFNTFPYRQIADILGIPLGTVKSRLHAAVATFADKWKAANRSRSTS
jgi:RNA polymerase sigma-70 factor (ECF subfamily)